jgi:2-amino-4-hydroxy-6-hydroxymethyldihydropteridine diphosphokinase
VRALDASDGISVVARSSVYETEPVGQVRPQRDFLNAAVKVETLLDPRALLTACKRVERALGRQPGGVRHGSRPIDVDVLLLGDGAFADDHLTIPHPEIAARRFVLAPLVELDRGLTLPDGTSLAKTLAALGPGQRVERVEPL